MQKLPKIKFELANTERLYCKVTAPGTTIRKFKNMWRIINPKFWDSKNELVKRGFPDCDKINQIISTERNELEAVFKAYQADEVEIGPALIESVLAGKKGIGSDFHAFYAEFIELQATRHTPGYIRHLEVEQRSIQTFQNPLTFQEINTDFLERYERSLTGIKKTTLNTKMKRLKEVINRAIDRGLIEKKSIAGYDWPGYKSPERVYLTLAEIGKIENKIYKGEYDNDNSMLQIACYFLVECFSGTRFSDWGRFSIEKLIENRNFKIGSTQKNKQPIYLPLNKFTSLARIVDYIIEHEIKFTLTLWPVNRLLKILASDCKINKKLTTHIARHTFATMAAEKGFSLTWIAKAMGVSEGTASVYRKITAKGLESETEKIGGW